MLTGDLSPPSEDALTFEKVRSIAQVPQSPTPVPRRVIFPIAWADPLLPLLSDQKAVPPTGTATFPCPDGVQTRLKVMPVSPAGTQFPTPSAMPPLSTPSRNVDPPLLRKLSASSSGSLHDTPSTIGSKLVKMPRMRILSLKAAAAFPFRHNDLAMHVMLFRESQTLPLITSTLPNSASEPCSIGSGMK